MKNNVSLNNVLNHSDQIKMDKYRMILDEIGPFVFFNSPYAIIIYTVLANGEDFRIDLMNGPYEELWGRDLESIVGQTLKELVPGIGDTDYLDALKRVWFTGANEFIPGRMYAIPNCKIWREFSISKLPSGRLLVFARNVEEEKNREIQYSTFMNSALEGVFVTDEDGNYVDVNETASLITGYKREELLRMNVLDLLREEDKSKAEVHFRNLKQKGEEISITSFVHKNGDIRYRRVSAFTIEPLKRYMAFVQDITTMIRSRIALNETNIKLRNAFYNTLKTIAHVAEAKDMYSKGHHERVADLALKICCEMGLEEELGDKVYKAALVHDVGKIKIPSMTLNTARELSDTERRMLRQHPFHSRQFLSGIGLDEDVLELVEQHHERMDGMGYPRNLKGDQIHMGARILAVANTFDSMCIDKPHRCGLSREKALSEMEKTGSEAFDPEVLEAFFGIVKSS